MLVYATNAASSAFCASHGAHAACALDATSSTRESQAVGRSGRTYVRRTHLDGLAGEARADGDTVQGTGAGVAPIGSGPEWT
ncbi:hypothetical protein SCP_0302590 [Sparassis crispa]|uniref:Uncharacterized protein n=1 Tax=Sparassis crispa TaxID=139825 RepID=A0A401GEC7_9APHY|nr:hypothetical protein SCP_0302590 [Sparassis crispa]GBE80544.1 hypothetical protein SCP_0302590 [Sparassis crispa]